MKRLTLLLLAILLVAAPVCAQKREPGKVKTLVIDPGHGGVKPGAHGKQMWEKDLVLNVALKFGALVEKHLPDVKVIYTRTTDEDITLARRAEIANHAKADLFISVHANSHPTDKPTGVETFVMGLSQSKANLEVAKKENADILQESDYKKNSAYQGFDPNSPESYVMFAMYQNAYLSKSLDFANYIQKQYSSNLRSINRGVKQAELFVIYKTAMPAVLTEIGFISNPEEEKFMMSDEGSNKIALCLYNAFATYKAHEEGTQPQLLTAYDAGKSNAGKSSQQVAEKAAAEKAAAEKAAAEKAAAEKAAAEALAKAQAEEKAKAEELAKAEKAKAEAAAKEAEAKAAEQAKNTETAQQEVVKQEPKQEEKAVQEVAQPQEKSVAQPAEEVAEEPTTPKHKVSFRVQFLRSDKLLKAGDKQLKGLDNFTYYQSGNAYCYMWGDTRSLEAAKALQSDVRAKGFKDAFVIAFADGERISLQKAREMLQE